MGVGGGGLCSLPRTFLTCASLIFSKATRILSAFSLAACSSWWRHGAAGQKTVRAAIHTMNESE